LAFTISGASAPLAFRKLTAIRPSGSANTCDGTLHATNSYPDGKTTLFRGMPSVRLNTITSPSW
jgi:hypothetical protein